MSNTLAESKIPRVTEILKPFTSYDQVPKDILERAAAKGTSVHALCAGIAKGNWIPDGMIGAELLGFVQSFRKWADLYVKKFVIIEKRYTDKDDKYSGQMDFVVEGADDKLYLVDLKTGSTPQKTHPIQMAAYNSLLMQNQIFVEAALLVYLDKEGGHPRVATLDDEDLQNDLNVFECALHCYEYFKIRKKNGSKQEEYPPKNPSDNGGTDLHTKG